MKCLLFYTIWEYYGIAQESQRFSSSSVNCKQLCCLCLTCCGCHQCKAQRIWWICIKFIAHLLVFLKLFKILENNLGGGKKPFEMNSIERTENNFYLLPESEVAELWSGTKSGKLNPTVSQNVKQNTKNEDQIEKSTSLFVKQYWECSALQSPRFSSWESAFSHPASRHPVIVPSLSNTVRKGSGGNKINLALLLLYLLICC